MFSDALESRVIMVLSSVGLMPMVHMPEKSLEVFWMLDVVYSLLFKFMIAWLDDIETFFITTT